MTDSKVPTMALANGLMDKSKELQKEILMEKLRSKTSQYKNLSETSKAVRMSLLDKRWAIDAADRMILQKCLDSLQHCIKVSSLQSLIERLECLSRQLGLKFVVGNSGVNLFISSDMFYLEILVEGSGAVKDVKIHHEGKHDQQSCEELVSCISRGDFADFTAQLEGLMAVYQLNAEKKVKCKAFSALQSLEEDLCTLKHLQSYIKDPWSQVHKSPIGFLQKRRGGHAMRLTYFVSPYELLDKEKGLLPLTTELLTKGKPIVTTAHKSLVAPTHTPIGHSALVLLEGSAANKLQLSPIISNGQRQAKGGCTVPVYAPLVPQNSAMLPACFTLRLSEPMPLCSALAKIIQATTEVEISGEWSRAQPMMRLVATNAYSKMQKNNQELNLSRGLYVNLPDCAQCYLVTERAGLSGCLVRSVPLSHPSHVPAVLAALRLQAAFNTLVAGVVRHSPQTDLESTVILELSATSFQHVSVSLEHPYAECMCVVEVSLSEPAAPRAAVHCAAARADRLDDYVTSVLRHTMSIPLTIRALLKLWEREAAAKPVNGGYSALDGANFNPALGAPEPGGPPADRSYPNNVSHPHQGPYLTDSNRHMSAMLCSEDTKPTSLEDRKAKKRKSADGWSACQKKGKQAAMCDMMNSDSESDASDVNDDENTMNSTSSNSVEGPVSSVSQPEFASDAESGDAPDPPPAALAPLAPLAPLTGLASHPALAPHPPHPPAADLARSDLDNSNDADDDDNIRNSFQKSDHKRQKLKNKEAERSAKSSSSLLLDLTDGKPYMPSSVSITPIASAAGAPAPSMLGLDRRPGIEIIPITASAPPALPSSITITPITPSQAKSLDDRIRSDKKSKSSEERSKEKKKKRRKDDSMGPPEKVPPKQDPLTKPVSVSIKPTEGSASPPALLSRYSPTPARPKPGRSPHQPHQPHQASPRHDSVHNSPKHLAGYSSPKNHSVSSPKHGSSSSGKPSMSALKSAAGGSPSGKSAGTGYDLTKGGKTKDGYSSGSTGSRDKEKKHSGLSFSDRSSPKPKNPIKMKQLEITPVTAEQALAEPLVSPPGAEPGRAPATHRNRKGSLSAVIDKLKSAQHVGGEEPARPAAAGPATTPPPNNNKLLDAKNSTGGGQKPESKNPEYMVKPSSDGMKITINKTRTKESSGGSKSNYVGSGSKQSSPQLTPPGQGSPKTHTGLKPGVISGPASKKTQVMQSTKSGSNPSGTPPKNLSPSEMSGSNSSSPKVPYSKSSSGSAGINLTKSAAKSSSGSPKSNSTDISKVVRDREREKARAKLMGGNSDKSLFSSKSERHSSPSGARDEVDGDRYKSAKESNFVVESLIKPLDTSKFQIPKLKNQNTPDKNSPVYDRSLVNDLPRSLDQGKYSHFPHFHSPNARADDTLHKAYPLNVPKPLLNMGSMSPKTISKDQVDSMTKGESPQRGKEDTKDGFNSYPLMPLDFKTEKSYPTVNSEKREELKGCMRQEDVLLDFSASGSKVSGVVSVRPVFPAGPAPAPRPAPPADPAITDDDLMDEALVGPGK